MRQRGEYRIGARADAVWLALNDPEVLSQCVDGCQSMTRVGYGAFALTMKAKIGELNATLTADVKLADVDPPHAYTLEASIRGGAAGFATATALVSLIEEGRDTLLRYEIEGDVGGKLAQLGQRAIDAAARKAAIDFFARFGEIVAPGALVAATQTAPAPRGSLLASILIAMAAVAGLFALLRWQRPARMQTETIA